MPSLSFDYFTKSGYMQTENKNLIFHIVTTMYRARDELERVVNCVPTWSEKVSDAERVLFLEDAVWRLAIFILMRSTSSNLKV